MFFVFDGIDGAGKSTQMRLFTQWLEQQGIACRTCHDPGTTELGNRVRGLLLGRHEIPIHMRTEMLLFMSARCQLVEEVIRPALRDGLAVVCDRYVFSTVVYQGHAGDLDPDQIWTVNRVATDGLMPELTFILDLPWEVVEQRLGADRDRMESRGEEYFRRVREGYLAEAARWPTGVEVVDASGSVDQVQEQIRRAAAPIVNKYKKAETGGGQTEGAP